MFALYLTLTKAIREKVPGLNWIDLDKGQLDDEDQYNSLIHPAVLVSAPEVEWLPLSQGKEQGTGTVTVKTIVRLPAGTYDIDPLVDCNVEALLIADLVHEAVKRTPGINSRASSKAYPSGSFYVVENTYACLTTYGGPNLIQVPVQVKLTPHLFKPATA